MSIPDFSPDSAVRPFRHAPPWTEAELVRQAGDSRYDLTAWAAYSLGYEVGHLPHYLELVPAADQFGDDVFNAIPRAAFVVRLACDLLTAVVPTGLSESARRAANDLEGYNNHALVGWRAGRWVWSDRVAESLSAGLTTVLKAPFLPSTPLAAWFGLGRAIGEFLWKDPAPSPPRGRPIEDAQAVPFRPIVTAARALAAEDRNSLAELKELEALVDRPDSTDERGLRALYVERMAADWPDDGWDAYPNSPFFTQEVARLRDRIECALRGRPVAVQPPPTDHVPRWDKSRRQLFFGGQVIRSLMPKATTVIPILELFQATGWPQEVETQLAGEKKQAAIDSLNDKLQLIEFYATGSRYGIGWRVVPAAGD